MLISLGILTVGLLGVAALFPVGGFYMQQAEIADRGTAIAQAAMSDLVARGMLNPNAWQVMIPIPLAPPNANERPDSRFTSDGWYSPRNNNGSLRPEAGTFTRPFYRTLREALTLTSQPDVIAKQFGGAFVIDPMGVAAMALPRPNTGDLRRNMVATPFPTSASQMPATQFYAASSWQAWNQGTQTHWPIRRVTFQDPATGWQMNARTAEQLFRVRDDLSVDLPVRDDRPAIQRWDVADTNNDGQPDTPLARQWQGDYSWIATVVPSTFEALKGLAHNPESHAYDVSVVVLFKRTLPADPVALYSSLGANLTAYFRTISQHERIVRARLVSTGLNGGELLLEKLDDSIDESPFANLKVGQWIMLCGPHPLSRNENPRFVLNWHRVTSIDSEDLPDNRRLITLRGPQWPWEPAPSVDGAGDANHLSNNLCVGIIPGAVAVHTKTLRLENPRTSAWTNFPPPNSPPAPPYGPN